MDNQTTKSRGARKMRGCKNCEKLGSTSEESTNLYSMCPECIDWKREREEKPSVKKNRGAEKTRVAEKSRGAEKTEGQEKRIL